MGGCTSTSKAVNDAAKDPRNDSAASLSVPAEIECNKRTVFPEDGNAPVDTRPKLQQQPRRKSIDAPMPVIPNRDEVLESKRKVLEISTSQLEFFKMLDEKVEAGGGEDGENLDDPGQTSGPASVLDNGNMISVVECVESNHGLIT